MSKTPPCWENGVDCPKRRPGCQTNCEKLKPLLAHYAAEREARAKEAIYKGYVIPVIIRNATK